MRIQKLCGVSDGICHLWHSLSEFWVNRWIKIPHTIVCLRCKDIVTELTISSLTASCTTLPDSTHYANQKQNVTILIKCAWLEPKYNHPTVQQWSCSDLNTGPKWSDRFKQTCQPCYSQSVHLQRILWKRFKVAARRLAIGITWKSQKIFFFFFFYRRSGIVDLKVQNSQAFIPIHCIRQTYLCGIHH